MSDGFHGMLALTHAGGVAIFRAMRTRHGNRRLPALAVAASAIAVLAGACNTQSQIENIGGVPLTNGTAHVEITGDAEATYDAPLERAQVGSVDTIFVYRSEGDDVFSITGLGMGDTAKTSNNLALVVTKGDIFATSAEGECTVTLTHGDDGAENGTASCKDLDSSQGTIDVEATFSATK